MITSSHDTVFTRLGFVLPTDWLYISISHHCIIIITTLLLFDQRWAAVIAYLQFLVISQVHSSGVWCETCSKLVYSPVCRVFTALSFSMLNLPCQTLYHSKPLGDSPLWDWGNFPKSLHAVHKHFLPDSPVCSVLLGEKQRPLNLLMLFIYSCIAQWKHHWARAMEMIWSFRIIIEHLNYSEAMDPHRACHLTFPYTMLKNNDFITWLWFLAVNTQGIKQWVVLV